MSKSGRRSQSAARKGRVKQRPADKARRTRRQRLRRGGYTYKAKSRKSRQSRRTAPQTSRVNSVTKEIQRIIPNDPRFLEELFASIDTDGSGGIDRDEFYKYFSTKRD